jgi:hypothetical protein
MLPEAIQLEPAPRHHRCPAPGATDHRTDRHRQQFFQLMFAFSSSWVSQFRKCLQQRYRCLFHLSRPNVENNAFSSGSITTHPVNHCFRGTSCNRPDYRRRPLDLLSMSMRRLRRGYWSKRKSTLQAGLRAALDAKVKHVLTLDGVFARNAKKMNIVAIEI